VPKDRVPIEIIVGEQRLTVSVPVVDSFVALSPESEASAMNLPDAVTVPLIRLVVARSGDKGDHANIGVAARKPVYLPYIESALTTAAVRRYFAHVLKGGEQGRVERWHLPGTHSLNFLLYNALGGGGAASLRTDPQGKAYAQMLLDYPVAIPRALAASLGQALHASQT